MCALVREGHRSAWIALMGGVGKMGDADGTLLYLQTVVVTGHCLQQSVGSD